MGLLSYVDQASSRSGCRSTPTTHPPLAPSGSIGNPLRFCPSRPAHLILARDSMGVDKTVSLFHIGGVRLTGDTHVMRARIYKPAKTAMSSGTAKTHHWVLEFAPTAPRAVDPLMGWTSSSDMNSQVRLKFDTLDAAQDYAKTHGIEAVVIQPKTRKPNIRMRGYGENFATDRKGAWTH